MSFGTAQLRTNPGPAGRLCLLIALCLGGCSVNRPLPADAPDLGRDTERFGGDRRTLDASDFLALDAAMRDFVHQATAGISSPRGKLERLMQSLFNDGRFLIDYDPELTFTASQAFHRRRGNCLSTTALLVALAREAGLKASFQDVAERPRMNLDESFWIHARHVNAVVQLGIGELVTVDFDARAELTGEGDRIDDRAAGAQFFSNLGVNAMRGRDWALAHAHFRRAVALAPSLGYVWNNVGVLYRRAGFHDRAEEIFLYAIEVDADELRAMSNLVGLYRHLGRPDQAAALERRLETLRRRNPYYLYVLAHRAYRDHDYETSTAFLRQAIALNADEPAFHELLEKAEAGLGRR